MKAPRNVLPMLMIALVAVTALPAAGWSWSEEAGSVRGLWRLAGVMPAGVPSEEVPEGMSDRQFYWFYDNGTVSLVVETPDGTTRHKGVWKQNGNEVLIVWESGVRNMVRVVKLGEKHMILTGLDIRPLWFRFVR